MWIDSDQLLNIIKKSSYIFDAADPYDQNYYRCGLDNQNAFPTIPEDPKSTNQGNSLNVNDIDLVKSMEQTTQTSTTAPINDELENRSIKSMISAGSSKSRTRLYENLFPKDCYVKQAHQM